MNGYKQSHYVLLNMGQSSIQAELNRDQRVQIQ